MRSRALKLLVAAVVVVALGSVTIGLTSPDGSVDDGVSPVNQGPRPSTAAPATDAATSTAPQTDEPGPDLAPASTAGTWPGAPAGVVAAACTAVHFVFEHRCSRLSLPRRAYETSDFDAVLPLLDPRTVSDVYRPRIAGFVASPGSDRSGEQLGLVLFTARGTPRGATHASAGDGHVFYGPAFSTRGHARRAAWIDPALSTVAISVDRSSSQPRIEARLTASASLPVCSTASGDDALLTVPTRATFLLRRDRSEQGPARWRINGWTISRGDVDYGPLRVG